MVGSTRSLTLLLLHRVFTRLPHSFGELLCATCVHSFDLFSIHSLMPTLFLAPFLHSWQVVCDMVQSILAPINDENLYRLHLWGGGRAASGGGGGGMDEYIGRAAHVGVGMHVLGVV